MKKHKTPKVKVIPAGFWENRDWYSKKFPWRLGTIFPQGVGACFYIQENYPFPTQRWAAAFSGSPGEWFWDEHEQKRVRAEILKRSTRSRELPNHVLKSIQEGLQNFERVVASIGDEDLTTMSNADLYEWYEKIYWAEVKGIAAWGYITDSFLTSGTEDWLTDLIVDELKNKASGKELVNIIEVLSAPTMMTFVNEEHISLVHIAIAMNKQMKLKQLVQSGNPRPLVKAIASYPAIDAQLSAHRASYYWTENNYYQVYDFSKDHYVRKIIELNKRQVNLRKDLQQEVTRTKKNKAAKERVYKKYGISRRLQNILHNAEVFTYVQDIRKQGTLRLNHYLFAFGKELARRTNLTWDEAMAAVEPELEDILVKGKNYKKELARRVRRWFWYVSSDGYLVYSGGDAVKVDIAVFHQKSDFIMEVTGVVASTGMVKGIVRVLKSNKDIAKFKQGEILLTNNTTPEFVPAMKKAAAIVTEQGGITTHAAIVSRELGTPCVIGVKDATRIFKTGEKIVVDAVQGVVRKLS